MASFREIFEEGFKNVVEGLQRVEDQLGDVNDALKQFQSQSKKATASNANQGKAAKGTAQAYSNLVVVIKNYNKVLAASARQQNQNRTRLMRPQTPAFTRGPASALRAAQYNYSRAAATGDPDFMFNAAYQYHQARSRYQRAWQSMHGGGGGSGGGGGGRSSGGGSWGSSRMSVPTSTSGAASAAMGMIPIHPVLKVAIVAISASVLAGFHAMAKGREMASTMLAGNMNLTGARRLDRLAALAGVNPREFVASINASMQEGYGASFARQMGITPYGSPYGGPKATAYGEKALTVLQNFLNEKNDLRAMQLSKAFPALEELAWMRYLSPEKKKDFMEQRGKDLSQDSLRKAADAQYEYNRALKEFNDAWRDFGTAFLPILTWILNKLSGKGSLAPWDRGSIVPGVPGPGPKYADLQERQIRAEKEQTEALRANTAALSHLISGLDRTFGNGMFGSWGSRGRRGAPMGWGQMQFDAQVMGQGVAFGAFAP